MDSFTNTFSLDIKFRFGISYTVILIYALHKCVSESQVSYYRVIQDATTMLHFTE